MYWVIWIPFSTRPDNKNTDRQNVLATGQCDYIQQQKSLVAAVNNLKELARCAVGCMML